MKRCGRCKEELPLDRFNKNKCTRDGLQCYCKTCKAAANKASPSRPEVIRKSRFRRAYGIEGDDLAVIDAIKFCAICYGPAQAVDHCHHTGKVRGVLCHACNTSLGKMHDSPAFLRRAAEYLEKTGEPQLYGH